MYHQTDKNLQFSCNLSLFALFNTWYDLKVLFVSVAAIWSNLQSHVERISYQTTPFFDKPLVAHILKTIKNATDTSVVILIYSNVIYYLYISNGLPFVRERVNKT